MSTGIIIQARVGSRRLSEKILKPLPFGSETTVLDQVIRRVKKTKKIDRIIVATTKEPGAFRIEKIAKKNKVNCFRGDTDDVLNRYYQAAGKFSLSTVVRVTSDCPCIDWQIIGKMIEIYEQGKYDYVSNSLKRTFPHGLDAEVFSFSVLEKAYLKAKRKDYREHVTPYIYCSRKFKVGDMLAGPGQCGPEIRITLDTDPDYVLLCAVYDLLYKRKKFFTAEDIVRLFKDRPWLKEINSGVSQKKLVNSLSQEIKEAIKVLDLQDLKRASQVLRKFLHK